jgi:hypothetical protein
MVQLIHARAGIFFIKIKYFKRSMLKIIAFFEGVEMLDYVTSFMR